jgi:hypothetical protein
MGWLFFAVWIGFCIWYLDVIFNDPNDIDNPRYKENK